MKTDLLFGVTATVETDCGGWRGMVQVPYFVVDGNVQGFTTRQGAMETARRVIDPIGQFGDALHVHCEPFLTAVAR